MSEPSATPLIHGFEFDSDGGVKRLSWEDVKSAPAERPGVYRWLHLNRLSPESYVLPVTASMQISINQQYLMARYKDVCISAAVVVVVVGCLLACCACIFAEAYPWDTRHLVQGCS